MSMSWTCRSYASSPLSLKKYERTYSTPKLSNRQEDVPRWVSILPAATGLWNMIKTLRDRGNHELASSLETAAQKQAESHLKTEQLMCRKRASRSACSSYTTSANRTPGQEPTPTLSRSNSHKILSERNQKDGGLHESAQYKTKFGNSSRIQCEGGKSEETDKPIKKEDDTSSLYSWVSEENWNSDWEEYCEDQTKPEDNRLQVPVCVKTHPPTPTDTSPSPERSPSPPLKINIPLPKNPNACYHHRLRSYSKSKFRWTSPSPSELAEAGFYFIGPSDSVRCFSCETCQRHWKTAEDPWVRHSSRSPSCDYVIETRGEDFISKILSEVKHLAYSRTGSNSSLKGKQEDNVVEFTKMKNGLLNTQAKLRETKRPSSSGWRLDPYKERNVVGKKKN